MHIIIAHSHVLLPPARNEFAQQQPRPDQAKHTVSCLCCMQHVQKCHGAMYVRVHIVCSILAKGHHIKLVLIRETYSSRKSLIWAHQARSSRDSSARSICHPINKAQLEFPLTNNTHLPTKGSPCHSSRDLFDKSHLALKSEHRHIGRRGVSLWSDGEMYGQGAHYKGIYWGNLRWCMYSPLCVSMSWYITEQSPNVLHVCAQQHDAYSRICFFFRSACHLGYVSVLFHHITDHWYKLFISNIGHLEHQNVWLGIQHSKILERVKFNPTYPLNYNMQHLF